MMGGTTALPGYAMVRYGTLWYAIYTVLLYLTCTVLWYAMAPYGTLHTPCYGSVQYGGMAHHGTYMMTRYTSSVPLQWYRAMS